MHESAAKLAAAEGAHSSCQFCVLLVSPILLVHAVHHAHARVQLFLCALVSSICFCTMLEFICSVPSALSADVRFSIYLLRAVHMTHSQRQFNYARSDELHLCTGGSKPDYLAIAQVLRTANLYPQICEATSI